MRALNLLLPFLATATAQNLLIYSSTALPDCAQQCTLLQNAASGCVPPAAPVTNTVTYESCFCQSGYLTGVKAGSDSSVCADVCGADDVQKIGQWYRSNCQDNGVAAAAVVDAGGSSTSTTAGTTATSAAATGTSSGTKSTNAASAEDEDGHHDWWTDHWKWIVMLIVIFVGLAILTVILVLVRRCYHRRQDVATERFNSGITRHSQPILSATPPPSHHPHSKQPSVQTSRTSLPRVREKDRMTTTDVPVPPVPSVPDMRQRGATPELERGQARGGIFN